MAGALRRRPRDRGPFDRAGRTVDPGGGCAAREPRAAPAPRGGPPEAARRVAALHLRLPRPAALPVDARPGAPAPRCGPGAGPGGHRPTGAAAHRRVPGLQAAAVPPAGAPAARRPGEQRAPSGAGAVRGGGLRAADRLRERGEPPPGPGRRARARAGSAGGPGREPSPPRPPAPHRGPAAVPARCSASSSRRGSSAFWYAWLRTTSRASTPSDWTGASSSSPWPRRS